MSAIITLAHAAGCACCKLDVIDAYVRESDRLVAKALAVSEVAQIARIETRATRTLIAKWQVRASQAARSAGAVYAAGGSLAAAFAAADKAMRAWQGDVTASYAQSLADSYKLARAAGHKKATGKYTGSLQYTIGETATAKAKPKSGGAGGSVKLAFDITDERAIDKLQKQELWWIGDTYKGVAPTIRDSVQPKVLAGLGRKEGGKLVQSAVEERLKDFRIPDGFHGPAAGYFEGLAANAVTMARVTGQLGSFAKLGVTTYTIVNPMDSRTSDICAELNGTEFKVADAETQLAKLGGAKTPDAYKSIKPWLSGAKISALAGKGAGALAGAGQMFPPFHFRCRSTVDVAHESLSFSALED